MVMLLYAKLPTTFYNNKAMYELILAYGNWFFNLQPRGVYLLTMAELFIRNLEYSTNATETPLYSYNYHSHFLILCR